MRFDDLLVIIGEFGPSQKRLFVLLSLQAIYYAVVTNFVIVFLFAVPQHRCAIPGIPDDTYEVQGHVHALLINASIPMTNDEHGNLQYSPCEVYVASNETSTAKGNTTATCDRWVYSKKEYESTVSAQFNFVCSKKAYPTHTKGVAMAGKLFSMLVTGYLSDRFGRRIVILGSLTPCVLFTILMTWADNIYVMLVLVFIVSSCATTTYHTCFVHVMEITGPTKRMLTGIAICLFWTAGNMIIAPVAYFLRDWKIRQLALGVPGLLLGIVYVIPESPRWLLRVGKKSEMERELLKMAHQNKVTLTSETLDQMVSDNKEEVWELFKSKIMMKRLSLLCFNWFAAGMCYFGLSMNLTNLAGDIYLNFFLFTLVEGASFALCLLVIKRFRRKPLVCGGTLCAGITCIVSFIPFLVTPNPSPWILNTLACFGNSFVSAAFAVLFMYTNEVMPTTARNSGLGISSVFSRIGSVISPYINDLTLHVTGRYSRILPIMIFGGITVLSGVLILLLPETNNKRLPETILEAEKLGTDAYDEEDMTANNVNLDQANRGKTEERL